MSTIESKGEVKGYAVRFPLVGVVSFYVEAESEQEAIEKSREIDWRLKVEPDDSTVEIEEIDMVERVATGNVLHAPLNRVEVVES